MNYEKENLNFEKDELKGDIKTHLFGMDNIKYNDLIDELIKDSICYYKLARVNKCKSIYAVKDLSNEFWSQMDHITNEINIISK